MHVCYIARLDAVSVWSVELSSHQVYVHMKRNDAAQSYLLVYWILSCQAHMAYCACLCGQLSNPCLLPIEFSQVRWIAMTDLRLADSIGNGSTFFSWLRCDRVADAFSFQSSVTLWDFSAVLFQPRNRSITSLFTGDSDSSGFRHPCFRDNALRLHPFERRHSIFPLSADLVRRTIVTI